LLTQDTDNCAIYSRLLYEGIVILFKVTMLYGEMFQFEMIKFEVFIVIISVTSKDDMTILLRGYSN
jgi:hypothetical protein